MRKVKRMKVITLHKCQRCGKIWFPRMFEKPKLCPTCSSVSDYMDRMRQQLAKSDQNTSTNSAIKEH